MIKTVAVLLGTTALMSCTSDGTTLRCGTGDMTSLEPALSKGMQTAFGPWVHDVRVCRIGDYVIVTPATTAASGEILVGRRRRPLFYSDDHNTHVMDASGKRLLFSSTKGRTPQDNTFISYTTFDPAQNAWIETVDYAGDGSVDFRMVEGPDQNKRTEYNVAQRWLELIHRGSLSGVMLNGEFMTPAAAREKLSTRAE